MYSMEEFARLDSSASRWEKEGYVFALSIYGLVIFPRALVHVDEAVLDLFDRLDKGVTLVPAILAETFRSLNACRQDFVPSLLRTLLPAKIDSGYVKKGRHIGRKLDGNSSKSSRERCGVESSLVDS
ncbi:hypothetical protein Goklo_024638 [Gossypium klotzschianum]|uniref:DUF7745 domain-containing protein n=1 Tax=Gossypium klotzschianum TaxID=34286 RepID=A0A7J8WBC5_9ROSI|nr:hypothetical protein [Gossypium klotzschianum]